MAGARSMGCACMVMVLVLIGAAAVVVVVADTVLEEGCPRAAYAYPFQSVCNEPALFDVEYHLVAPFSNALVAKGGLTLGTGSSVSFTGNQSDEGLKFKLTRLSEIGFGFDSGNSITLGTGFTITNTETQMKLGWKYVKEYKTLVLSFVDDDSSAAQFHLSAACNVPLPCPTTTGARCESYFFVTSGLVGLTGLGAAQGGATYIKPSLPRGQNANLPLLLRRVDV